MKIDELTSAIIDAAIKVHRALGPGLLESTYEACLFYELNQRRYVVRRQIALPVRYEGVLIETGYRIDLLVEDCVVVELKSVDCLGPIHAAQLITYLKLSGSPVGLILNFNVTQLKDGIVRKINHQTFKSGDDRVVPLLLLTPGSPGTPL